MEIFMKIWEKMKWKSSLISLFNLHYLPDKDGELNDAKNEDEDEKTWKMNLICEFSILKLGYMAISMKICGKQNLAHFLGHFW